MANIAKRKQLEEAIAEKSIQVPMSWENRDWVKGDQMEALHDAWYDLADYYAHNNDDTEISVDVLQHYLYPTRLLRKLLVFEEYAGQREDIEEVLGAFELMLDKIITEVGTFLNQDR
jgi:hypothetical protein